MGRQEEEDNTCLKMDFTRTTWEAGDRTRWKRIIVKSSVVP